jgi:cyanophycinase
MQATLLARPRALGLLLLAAVTTVGANHALTADDGAAAAVRAGCADHPTVGPVHGWLVIVGGGTLGKDVLDRFIFLAGGPQAAIVVIPTAGHDGTYGNDTKAMRVLREAGCTNLTVLHAQSRKEADSAPFVKPLRQARGVWIGGGRQWRLADAYLDTATERELHALLDRGGVIGGSSAGASIQASYLVRGAPEGNQIMMAAGHERGFGFLRDAAVDQHVLVRHRQNDLLEVVRAHPNLLGIGIDESTAIVVHGNDFEVVGPSKVAVYGVKAQPQVDPPYLLLSAGEKFDLASRCKQ